MNTLTDAGEYPWQEQIEPLFLRLVAVKSDSNTAFEGIIEELILSWLKGRKYFTEHPAHTGSAPLQGDMHNRRVLWGLVKGRGAKTVVLIHHHDTVDTADYGKLRDLALRPDELAAALSQRRLQPAVRADLESGRWLFGRGTADMKAGAAIQLAALDRFSQESEPEGNLLVLSVPDEESLSRGMLEAVRLMDDLRKEHGLEYILTVNSEPYFNQVRGKAILFEGSVGKVMPIVYVRGVKSHVGDPYAGINPSLILANIQRLTELNTELCDVSDTDATPPPVWVNLKDRKKAYDASIPEAATGYFNWLTFNKTPADIIEIMMDLSSRALNETLSHHSASYRTFCEMTGDKPDLADFEPLVLDFATLFARAREHAGNGFSEEYRSLEQSVADMVDRSQITLPEAAIRLLEFCAEASDLQGPAVVIGLSGPYYPHVANANLPDGSRYDLHRRVDEMSRQLYGVSYESRKYFMGISDTSYASWTGDDESTNAVKENSPGWGGIYRIPFASLKKLNSPVLNLGPWGKDLHKPTERVFAPDVYNRVPEILYRLIADILGETGPS